MGNSIFSSPETMCLHLRTWCLFILFNVKGFYMKFPNHKRITVSILTGAFLGIFCIIGVGTRIGFNSNIIYLIGMWYNRVIMGLLVGLAGEIILIENDSNNSILRGAIIGLVVTTGILLSTSFKDIPSFFAGIIYGIIIDYISTKKYPRV